MSALGDVFLNTKGLSVADLESFGEALAIQQRGVNWWIGDVARYAKYGLKMGDNYTQVFPPWMSPGLIQRCEAVAIAYPTEESRNPLASWTQHMTVAKKAGRIELVAAMVEAGQTSDESRKAHPQDPSLDGHSPISEVNVGRKRWLLAVDCNYWLAKTYHAGAEMAAAEERFEAMCRMVERLKLKGLTDAVFCFDSSESFRKELTKDWEKPYKSRVSKSREWTQQIPILRDRLERAGYLCVSYDGFEADDLLASYAAQFDGNVTMWTVDKDMQQCLSPRVNMLIDSNWEEDSSSGDNMWSGEWLTAKQHNEGTTYQGAEIKNIPPSQWPELQALAGDSSDTIDGAIGIGGKIAADLLIEFETIEAAIQAAKDDDERITPKKREALIEFEPKLAVTRQLVTLVDTLPISSSTRI